MDLDKLNAHTRSLLGHNVDFDICLQGTSRAPFLHYREAGAGGVPPPLPPVMSISERSVKICHTIANVWAGCTMISLTKSAKAPLSDVSRLAIILWFGGFHFPLLNLLENGQGQQSYMLDMFNIYDNKSLNRAHAQIIQQRGRLLDVKDYPRRLSRGLVCVKVDFFFSCSSQKFSPDNRNC